MRLRVLVDPVVAYQDTSNEAEYQNRAFSLVGQFPITRLYVHRETSAAPRPPKGESSSA